MSASDGDLTKRVQILERKIAREKKARGLAEKQLEEYSREIYKTNQSLQRSLAFAKKKQAELGYLGEASADISSDLSLKELLLNTIALTGEFFNAKAGLYIPYVGNEVQRSGIDNWLSQSAEEVPQELVDFAISTLPDIDTDMSNNWLITEVNPSLSSDYKWLVYTNFRLLKRKSIWIAFYSDVELLDEESLYVLDTARGHLQNGIKRRLNDVRILKRTVELQETVDHLDTAKRQLVQSEKMASLGQLAAGVAHEINNPIGFIRSNSEMLGDYIDDFKTLLKKIEKQVSENNSLDAQEVRSWFENIDVDYLLEDSEELLKTNVEGLDRVREIVDNLKTFSHSGDDKLVKMSLNDCIAGALKITSNALKYQHEVNNNLGELLPEIKGNSGQLQQVFVNLFVNAAQAMEDGGTLTLNSSIGEKRIVVDISDTGCGMDEDTKNKLFTPFFTTKEIGVGTGLGLSVSYAILESHGIDIQVSSKVGEGTTFRLIIPR